MDIPVAAALGRGPTSLAAFDAALVGTGIADRNLIYLSSVLPPRSEVRVVDRLDVTPGGWGDRLYCVLAQATATEPGSHAWAGIGWIQDDTGRGLLVEHHADDEDGLRGLLDASLDGLSANRGTEFPHRSTRVIGGSCTDRPVCALVVAVFEATGWRAGPPLPPGERPGS
jgi:arginine decarboxylase